MYTDPCTIALQFDKQLMATFTEFVEAKPQKDEQISDVERYTVMLCYALYMNKKDQDIRYHQQCMDRGMDSIPYHVEQLNIIANEGIPYRFYVKKGRKYHKVIMQDGTHRSVHCFVDMKTGDVYKSASFNAPAKGVRFNLLDEAQREWVYDNADWSGGYLYRNHLYQGGYYETRTSRNRCILREYYWLLRH